MYRNCYPGYLRQNNRLGVEMCVVSRGMNQYLVTYDLLRDWIFYVGTCRIGILRRKYFNCEFRKLKLKLEYWREREEEVRI